MKILKYRSLFFVLVASLGFAACTKDFEEMNTDPNNTVNVLPQQLLAPTLVDIVTYNMIRNRNFNNELMQVTVDLGDGEGKVFRYDYRSTWSDYLYNGWYSQLTNLKDIYRIADDSLTLNNSYKGVSLILQSWVYSLLTDTYGDVPYTESNLAKTENGGIREPKFDKQSDIYRGIFRSLEEANTLLSATGNTGILGSSDPVFNGNISKWRKFGNSLYLRLLLRVSGKAEVKDSAIAKIKDIVVDNRAKYPIISSNDESAILRWTGVAPYTSPYVGVRAQDFRGTGMASFFMDNLVTWNDPRINIVNYGTNGVNRWGIAPGPNGFSGVPSGYSPGEAPIRGAYFYAMDQTVAGSNPPAITMQLDPMTGQILNYAEVLFILAEAAAKGWIPGNAGDYYKEGIKNSITMWLPNWNEDIDKYIAAADITWNEAGTLQEKMEQIHLQKYYALFMTDLQQWFEYRRTGLPALPKGSGLRNNGEMPSRMTYPVYVQSTNPTNYKQVLEQQGPDLISTKVWWQKP